jgi:isopenicillin-N epimerase
MKQPQYTSFESHWKHDREITFLNHGSFGSTPTEILNLQNEYRTKLEAEPIRFMVREFEGLWDDARSKTATFLGTAASNLVFVKNTTMGVNTIFHSLEFNEGDEVLVHSHVYGACLNTINYYAKKKKFTVKIAHVPFPIQDENEVTEALVQAISPKTKLLFVDHITSATGIIFPVKEIVKQFHQRGIEVFIDGAHAPGMVDLQLDELGADYYTGNAHKWICSPKGSAILYVLPEKQKNIIPLQISHNYDKSNEWAKQFLWPGTDDYTAYLCVPAAIEFMSKIFPGGWKELRERNRNLSLTGRKLLSEKLGTSLPAPDNMIGHLANVYLGKAEVPTYGFNYIHPVQDELFNKYKIEVPVFVYNRNEPRIWVRIATQCYNDISQIEYLGDALFQILSKQ